MDTPKSLPTTASKIKLTWYEEIHVRMYRKFCPDFPRNRIISIDWFKGCRHDGMVYEFIYAQTYDSSHQ